MRSKFISTCCALALSLSACVENDTSVFVAGVLKGKTPECEFKADQGSARLASGLMDVGFTTTYHSIVLVGLQLAPRGDKTKLRAEAMTFNVRGAEVRLTESDGTFLEEFSVPAGGTVTPSSAAAPGFGLSEVVLVHNDRGEKLRAALGLGDTTTLVAQVRVFGETLGGTELTSAAFDFVIEVCHACSAVPVEDGINPDRTCNQSITEDRVVDSCFFGQDGANDCRDCQTTPCEGVEF